MNHTELHKLFFASLAVTILFYGYADSAEEDTKNQFNAMYLSHPDDSAGERPSIPGVADKLARAFLTPKLALKHEPVDIFYVPNVEFEKFPEKAAKRFLKTYRKRHAWKKAIKLNVQSTLLDLKEPSQQIASAEQLKTAVKKNTTLSAFIQFCHLILGDDSDNADAMAKSVMNAFFFDSCRHTLVLQVGDGDQLQGFLLGTVRTRDDNNRVLVGLLVVWD